MSRGDGIPACLSWPRDPWQAPVYHLDTWIFSAFGSLYYITFRKKRKGINDIFSSLLTFRIVVSLSGRGPLGLGFVYLSRYGHMYIPFFHINHCISCISSTLFSHCFFLLKYIFWEEFHINVYFSSSGMFF